LCRICRRAFWGDFQGQTRELLKKLLEADAEQQMADCVGLKWHERASVEQPRVDYRNGFCGRDYVTLLVVRRLASTQPGAAIVSSRFSSS
jgi:hypothetical protein